MVAIGLQKPYAKIKVGEFCTYMIFFDSVDGCWYQVNVYEKGKTLTLCSNLELAVGDDVVIDEDVDE
jgi:hypothetical protein